MNTRRGEQYRGKVFEDLDRKRGSEQRRYFARRPKRIDNVIAQVVQQRGYAQIRAVGQRDQAWEAAAGAMAAVTRVGALRRGTLEIYVDNSLQIQELTFRKEELITKLQAALPNAGIKQLKFRVGQVNETKR